VVETELALIAEVPDVLDVGGRQLLDVTVDRLHVEPVEQDLERWTERQTATTPATDVIDPAKLLIDLPRLPELRHPKIQRPHSPLQKRSQS
jgi:hypothetical protein